MVQDQLLQPEQRQQLGAQVLVMQRLHERDLGGYLTSLGWPALTLPAVNDHNRHVSISKSRSHFWREGELLHPEHEPASVLAEFELILAPRGYSAQYLQNPLPERGNLIQRVWLKTYDADPSALSGGQVIQSWDFAASQSEAADYSACVTARNIGSHVHVLDVWRGRLPLDQLRDKIIALDALWQPSPILIENSSSGSA